MSENAHIPDRPMSRGQILAFGAVSLPVGTIGLPIAIYLAPLYSGQLGLSLQLIGVALILARLADFVTDPLIGLLTDRWRPSIGRRRVWLIIGTAIMMVGVYYLFQPSAEAGIVYFLAAVSVVYLGYTAILLPYQSWAAELSPDYHVRTRISSVTQFFSISGLIISTVIPAYMFSQGEAGSAEVMRAISLFVLVALPICSGLAFFSVREPELPVHKVKLNLPILARMLWSNKAFLRVTLVLFTGTVGEVFRQTITVFFARDVAGVENIGLVYLLYFTAALICVPAWTWLARRIEKHRTLAIALLVVALTNASMFFVGKGQENLFTLLFILKGTCYGAVLLLPHAMVADTVDIDTAETLDRQQGIFYAAIAMVQKMGYALGAGLPLLILGAFDYNSAGETRSEPLFALSVTYSVIPCALVLCAAAIVWGYGLTEERHREIRDRIAARESHGQETTGLAANRT